MRFQHRFVEDIPDTLESQMLYIAIDCGAVVHLCACGCGNESVTPLGRTDWSITYDGETVSLSPSVGNWSFPCQSHYFIKKDNVRWAPKWSDKQIDAGRRYDRQLKDSDLTSESSSKATNPVDTSHVRTNWVRRAVKWLAG